MPGSQPGAGIGVGPARHLPDLYPPDGDQLMMMNGGELGNWYSPCVRVAPVQRTTEPLLVEFAPALFEKYARTTTPNDCLVAGRSGAGYHPHPWLPDLPAYLEESGEVPQLAGISHHLLCGGSPGAGGAPTETTFTRPGRLFGRLRDPGAHAASPTWRSDVRGNQWPAVAQIGIPPNRCKPASANR